MKINLHKHPWFRILKTTFQIDYLFKIYLDPNVRLKIAAILNTDSLLFITIATTLKVAPRVSEVENKCKAFPWAWFSREPIVRFQAARFRFCTRAWDFILKPRMPRNRRAELINERFANGFPGPASAPSPPHWKLRNRSCNC